MKVSARYIARDDALLEYATDRERELVEAYWKLGNAEDAAEACGLSRQRSTVCKAFKRLKARAARAGYDPATQHTRVVPEGYRVKGTSSLYVRGEAEPAVQWVKTTIDQQRQEELLREMLEGFCDDLPRVKATQPPKQRAEKLCAVYPVGDHHVGMYAWAEEAGEDYDVSIAEKLLSDAFAFLTKSLPPAEQALIVLLGDLFHYDSMESVTPASKNLLDADGRYAKMVRTVIRVVRAAIAAALRRHGSVHLIVQPGNHDPSSSIMLMESLAAVYEQEPRVTVDTSPSPFHYWRWGQNLVGVCHGHEVKKLSELPLLMATDRAKEWGETQYRYWYTGHIHSDKVLDEKGVRVESFRILPPTDAWAHSKGYRSGREMKGIVLHADYGETMRLSFRPGMLD